MSEFGAPKVYFSVGLLTFSCFPVGRSPVPIARAIVCASQWKWMHNKEVEQASVRVAYTQAQSHTQTANSSGWLERVDF